MSISVVAAPTSEALALAERGAADVTITHQPEFEAAFLAAHPAASGAPAFRSHFLVVGPPGADPVWQPDFRDGCLFGVQTGPNMFTLATPLQLYLALLKRESDPFGRARMTGVEA